MPTDDKQRQETKLTLKKSQVSIGADGQVSIKDPNLARTLAANELKDNARLAASDITVGVVVSKSF
ncbi:MAG: hypothetical protein QE484_16065 [Rhizobium sp.]|nr:hypothetical protein [Rhizobium sp.]